MARHERELGLVGTVLGGRLLRRWRDRSGPHLFRFLIWAFYRILGGLGRRRKDQGSCTLRRRP